MDHTTSREARLTRNTVPLPRRKPEKRACAIAFSFSLALLVSSSLLSLSVSLSLSLSLSFFVGSVGGVYAIPLRSRVDLVCLNQFGVGGHVHQQKRHQVYLVLWGQVRVVLFELPDVVGAIVAGKCDARQQDLGAGLDALL